ncbi:hypothetical protein [Oleiharenicola sp. Vm1]|uniref:hypothetical protein n=1 Tax=Oleiharenicola sp. Vm1 TaxID=3398393 RepID=UPI0039F4D2BE
MNKAPITRNGKTVWLWLFVAFAIVWGALNAHDAARFPLDQGAIGFVLVAMPALFIHLVVGVRRNVVKAASHMTIELPHE